MSLPAGAHLGPYDVIAPIGAGGMGEVYRAHDPRLRRNVAIKLLPTHVSGDPDRLRRFEQEARAAAALNHPNILTVHEIGSADGVPYVVSELLEGQTLRETLSRGPLTVRMALAYAVQILNGLAAAHDKGIVHRDIKPENLFVTTDGRMKILDFGLAKLVELATVSVGPTVTATGIVDTTPGMVLGTVGYMSPEQVRGQTVDWRSDLFSFGAVLYEMLCGERAFTGNSVADTMSAILLQEPRELTVSARGPIPAALNRIVQRCLEKEPDQRFQSARDLAFALEAAPVGSGAPADRSSVRPWYRRDMAVASAAAAALACGALALWAFDRTVLKLRDDGLRVHELRRVAHDVGFSEWPTWAPDGKMFAFSSNRFGNYDIFVGRVDGNQEPVNRTPNEADNVQPALSPEGDWIAFVSTRSSRTRLAKIGTYVGSDIRTYGGDIWVIPALGGQPKRLAEGGNFPVWHPNGRSVAYVTGTENRRAIFEVSLDGGSPHAILDAEKSKWEIDRLEYSPDGRWITFETANDRRVIALPAGGGTPVELLRGRSHAWAPTGGRLYYVKETGAAVATQIEAADVADRPQGLAVTRVQVVTTNTGALHHLAIAPDGRHLLVADDDESLNLTRLPLSHDGASPTGPEEALSTIRVRDRYPVVSPDGRNVLLSSNRADRDQLWTVDFSSGDWRRVQLPRKLYDDSDAVVGCWRKDSQRIVAMTVLRGVNTLWAFTLADGSIDRIAPPAQGGSAVSAGGFACSVSPKNDNVLVFQRLVGSFTQLVVFDVASRRERPLTTTLSHKYDATWSPDGKWIVFSADTGGAVNVWRIPVDGGQEQQLTKGDDRMRHFFYSNDGRWLYVQPNHRNIYRTPADGYRTPVDIGHMEQVTRFPDTSNLFIEEPTITPDGRYLVYSRSHGGSSIWLLTLDVP